MAKKAKSGTTGSFGAWAFLIGVVLAVVLGFLGLTEAWAWLFVIIGLIIGLLNITDDEVHRFLMAGAVLIIASAFGGNALRVLPTLTGVLEALLAIFVPATIIVAIKHVFILAKD